MSTKPVIAVTGGSGLVGSWFSSTYQRDYELIQLDVRDPIQPVDITEYEQVMAALSTHNIAAIVHFAAYTDVTGAWNQSGDKSGIAYAVNVTGTETMVRAANALSAHLIAISTAYVFDGTQTEPYKENDPIHPIEWYGETKALAETAVTDQARDWSILRIDQPFRPDSFPKADTLHRICTGLANSTLYPQFRDHTFGPTYIPDFAKVLDWVLRTHATGLFHATSGESWTDYAFAQAVAVANDFDPTSIKKGSLAAYLQTSKRPYQKNTALNCEKLTAQLDFALQPIASVLKLED